MFSMNSKYEEVKVYAETIEDEAISQITSIANSPLGEDAHIRIMLYLLQKKLFMLKVLKMEFL